MTDNLFELEHRIIFEKGRHIVICCHHYCDLEGISKEEYEIREQQTFSSVSRSMK